MLIFRNTESGNEAGGAKERPGASYPQLFLGTSLLGAKAAQVADQESHLKLVHWSPGPSLENIPVKYSHP
jgi:hypothetical protein